MNEEDTKKTNIDKNRIIELVRKIKNPATLKRIYQLAEYLYIYKEEKE